MEGKTCCVTGHRDLPQKEINYVKTALRREIDSAVADGFTRFMSGFADGVDQYFAKIVLEKKKTNPVLELIAVIPYQKRLDSLMAKGRTVIRTTSISPRVRTFVISKLTVVPWSMACSMSSHVSIRLARGRVALTGASLAAGAGSGISR